MLEIRVLIIGLIITVVCAVLSWCSHIWFYDIGVLIGIGTSVFGYAYMDK